MSIFVNVGKNVARILDREFPIDTDLVIGKFGSEQRSWNVKSINESHIFTPVKEGEVSTEAFRTYNQALNKSVAFNERGKLRRLFNRKEEGVKVVPGHGVFILPAKMHVVNSGRRNIQIRVFSGTEFAESFQFSNYEFMVQAASEYYFRNLRAVTDSINESLWYPVKYRRKEERTFDGLVLPDGVQVYNKPNGAFMVQYYSVTEGKGKFFGIAKSKSELTALLIDADIQRRNEQMVAAMYRFVRPSYIQLSQYMKTV